MEPSSWVSAPASKASVMLLHDACPLRIAVLRARHSTHQGHSIRHASDEGEKSHEGAPVGSLWTPTRKPCRSRSRVVQCYCKQRSTKSLAARGPKNTRSAFLRQRHEQLNAPAKDEGAIVTVTTATGTGRSLQAVTIQVGALELRQTILTCRPSADPRFKYCTGFRTMDLFTVGARPARHHTAALGDAGPSCAPLIGGAGLAPPPGERPGAPADEAA
jgi:hypothetical protein